MSLRHVLRNSLISGAGLALVGATAFAGSAGASGTPATLTYTNSGSGTVSLNPGSNDPNTGNPVTAGTPYSSGQTVELDIAANSVFSATALGASGSVLKVWQCSDANGLPSGLPTLNTSCDSNTIQLTTSEGDDGSLSIDIPVFSTPDTNIGDPAGATVCNAVSQCVFLITYDQTNLHVDTPPHLFSAPFKVVPSAGDSGASPGDGTPEVPLAIALPLLAAGLGTGAILYTRRRQASSVA